MVKIKAVVPHGIADAMGIRDGDVLVSINGHEIRDVLDYRFYLTDTSVRLSLLRDASPL